MKRLIRKQFATSPESESYVPAGSASYLPEPPSVIEGTTSLLDIESNRTRPIEFAEVQR